MKLKHAFLFLSVTLQLSACAIWQAPNATIVPKMEPVEMTRAQCKKLNLSQQGLQDGKAGKEKTEFTVLSEQCHKHKVKLNHKRYLRGWKEGNTHFCSSKNMKALAKQGQSFPTSCEHHHSAKRAYKKAMHAKRADTTATTINERPMQATEIDKPNTTISAIESQLIDLAANKEQIKNDLDFFHDGVVHDQRVAQLAALNAREQALNEQLAAMKETKDNDNA